MKIDDTKLIKILTILIGVVCIVAIILIVLVWKFNFVDKVVNREEPTPTIEQNLGKISYVDYTAETVLNKYLDIINNYLYNADIDNLYELLSDNYKETFNYTKEKLYSNFKGKNIFGKKFPTIKYSAASLNGFRVYAVSLTSEDNSVTFDLNIIEKSPNNFSFSLDKYILTAKPDSHQTTNGIELNIKDITYYNDRIVTRAKLTNSNDYKIFVNTQNANESIYYRIPSYDGDVDYITNAFVFGGISKEINSNSNIDLTFDSNISFSNFSAIDKLVLKDVKLSENGIITELEYDF